MSYSQWYKNSCFISLNILDEKHVHNLSLCLRNEPCPKVIKSAGIASEVEKITTTP